MYLSENQDFKYLYYRYTEIFQKTFFVIFAWISISGTFITEWDDGKVRCHKVIESEESFKRAANKLVEITKYYQFDGWLINIENVVEVNGIFMHFPLFPRESKSLKIIR